jgi:NitT/TauT family transport system substrate-binding protein
MNRKLIVLVLLVLALVLSGCMQAPDNETIKIGLQNTPESALVQVASEKGFFEQQGINVELEEFTAGKFALQAFLAGSLDFAVVGDVPIVLATMQGNDFYVLAEIAECPGENPVLVLNGSGLDAKEYFSTPGRKLTTSIGGTPEFYTYNFLKYYDIDENQVEIIAQKPEEMVAALISGSVDAISIFEPYPTMAEQLLPGRTTRFEIPDEVYSPRYVLVARKQWVDENPEKAKSLLKALIQTEEFIPNNIVESQKIVAKETKFSEDLIRNIWDKCEMKVGASEALVNVWDKEALWAIETGKLDEMPLPDFEGLLRRDLLDAAKAG